MSRTPAPPSAGATDLLTKSAVLRRLELEVHRRLDGRLTGDYVSLATGSGTERAGARRYEPGDDARRIDWSLTARSLDAHIRTTEADRELHTLVVVDRSPSLDFGTARREKREVVLATLAAFGVLTGRSGNRLAVVVAGGERLTHLPPRQSRAGVLAALSAVYDSPRRPPGPNPGADLDAALTWAHRTQRHRGQIVVASDFLDRSALHDRRDWADGLHRLALRHRVVAVHVTDPRELELAPVGMLGVVDVETGRHLHVQTNSPRLRERYAEAARARHDAIVQAVRQAGADYLHLSTDRDWVLDLAHFVTRRSVRP
jgi:uncharacterized protein (DUF58 family)